MSSELLIMLNDGIKKTIKSQPFKSRVFKQIGDYLGNHQQSSLRHIRVMWLTRQKKRVLRLMKLCAVVEAFLMVHNSQTGN